MGLNMALSESIKVDLYGQYNNDTAHKYTYPERVKSQYEFTEGTRWVAAIADPRALFQSVCKSGPCYLVYRHKNGYYYSLIERNVADSRGGLEMVTIFVPANKYAAGNSVLTALKELRNILIRDRKYDDTLVKQCISRIAAGLPSDVFPIKTSQEATAQPTTAFRTYKNDLELSELFSFLCQRDYECIDKLLFVGENDVKEGTSIRRVLAQVKKTFSVVSAPNASANKSEVSIGDTLVITYSKEDCEPLPNEVKLDLAASVYYKVDGNKLKLVGPDALGIKFNKKLNIRLDSIDRSRVDTRNAEVIFDGVPAKRLDNGGFYVLIPESDVFEGSKASINVNCPHFMPYQSNIPLENLKNGACATIKLTPKTKSVPIEFRFEDMGSDVLTLPVIDVPMKETDPILRTMQTEFSFYGYQVFSSPNGGYRVIIPRKRRSQSQPVEKKKGWPRWLKILVISLGSLLIAFLLLLGGYAMRSYDVVKNPGLTKSVTSETVAPPKESTASESKIETGQGQKTESTVASTPADTTAAHNPDPSTETQE